MKKIIKRIMFVTGVALILSSCASVQSPLLGAAYTDVKSPVTATSNANSTKVGTSQASSILGIVALGDASIDAAAKSAGITKIHHIDVQATSILGFFAKYKIYVYGE